MFKKIKSLFRKKEETEELSAVDALAAITIYADLDGELFVDVQMKDEDDETIGSLVDILKFYNAASFVQINEVMKSKGDSDLHMKIISSFVEQVGVDYFSETIKQKSNSRPCISPSDML